LQIALAREFYAVIVLSIMGGIAIAFMHFDPVKALYWSALIDGVAAVPIMVVLMLMASSQRVMGDSLFAGRYGGAAGSRRSRWPLQRWDFLRRGKKPATPTFVTVYP
jgi:Mn2+/Fe2+ NRAMP family transporter